MSRKDVIEVDGSYLEGGGQILRIAASLSALLKKNIHITKIRAGRSNPGLRPQHLKGLEMVKMLCDGTLEGAKLESTEVSLFPNEIKAGNFEVDTGTAGSITLLIQVSLPCALFSDAVTTMKFRGGTNVEMAPQIDYLIDVFSPLLAKLGINFECNIIKRGYYPRGGGKVKCKVNPIHTIKPVIIIERGSIQKIYGRAFVAGKLGIGFAQTMADSATDFLKKYFEENVDKLDPEQKEVEFKIEAYKEPDGSVIGTCSGINIIAQTSTGLRLGASALGKKDTPASEVGFEAASRLVDDIDCGACVDSHSQDQLMVFLSLAYGGSEIKVGPVTEHTKTAIHVCEKMTIARFNVISMGPRTNIIQCIGHGLKNPNIIES